MPPFITYNADTKVLKAANDNFVKFLDYNNMSQNNCHQSYNSYDVIKKYFAILKIMQSSKPIPVLNSLVFKNMQKIIGLYYFI